MADLIYFSRRNLSLLRYIEKQGKRGALWEDIYLRFDFEHETALILSLLTQEGYTYSVDEQGNGLSLKCGDSTKGTMRSMCTDKGAELIERRMFDFWKWIIPTLISVVALTVSALSLLLR